MNASVAAIVNVASYDWIRGRAVPSALCRIFGCASIGRIRPPPGWLAHVVVAERGVPVPDQQAVLVREVLDPVRAVGVAELYGPVCRPVS